MQDHARVQAPIRVMVVDDHEIVRRGVRALLEGADGIVVCAEAGGVAEALEIAEAALPDVIIIDLRLPDGGAAEAITKIRQHCPQTAAVVLTFHSTDEEALIESMIAGATAYLFKNAAGEDLIAAVRAVAQGDSYLDPTFASAALRYIHNGRSFASLAHDEKPTRLGRRETEVLELLPKGLSNKQIASALHIAESTVEHHLTSIYSKLGVNGRIQAAIFARLLRDS